jgi:hypothetical protein
MARQRRQPFRHRPLDERRRRSRARQEGLLAARAGCGSNGALTRRHPAGGLDAASYILSHPTLEREGEASVTLESLYIMVNGQFNLQHDIFAALSWTVSETTELRPRGPLVVSDDRYDTIILGFGKLELAK